MPTTVVLNQKAPWNARLGNPYRTRWAEVDGRYFRVRAESLNDLWTVEEVDADGEPLILRRPTTEEVLADRGADPDLWEFGFTEFVFTLAQAREKIAAEVERGA